MAYYYKREIPALNSKGKQKYSYALRSAGNKSLNDITEHIAQRHQALGQVTVLAIVSDIVDAVAQELANGYSVTIDGVGRFSVSLGLKAHDSDSEPNARSVEVRDVLFKASKQMVSNVRRRCVLQRDPAGTATLRRSPYTLEERIALALDFCKRNAFMRVSDYVALTGLSRTTASKELLQLTDDDTSPLQAQGTKSHKVYVARQ